MEKVVNSSSNSTINTTTSLNTTNSMNSTNSSSLTPSHINSTNSTHSTNSMNSTNSTHSTNSTNSTSSNNSLIPSNNKKIFIFDVHVTTFWNAFSGTLIMYSDCRIQDLGLSLELLETCIVEIDSEVQEKK